MQDISLRLEFHQALDAITPPAPWLADHVRRERRRHASRTPVGRAKHHRTADSPTWLVSAVAALLAVAIVLTLVLGVRELRLHSTPARQPQPVPTRQPLGLSVPIAADCSAGCNLAKLVFASPSVAWAIVGQQALGQTQIGPSNLYRTVDGGQHWQALVSWNNPLQTLSGELMVNNVASDSTAADQIKVSSDGREALVITGWGAAAEGSAGLFHTSDGGAHWSSFGFPAAAQPNPVCAIEPYLLASAPACAPQVADALQDFFLNPREGWVVSRDVAANLDYIFHTTDSGRHWVVAARVATNAAFDLTQGRLVFQSSTSGWFVPSYTGAPVIARTVYRTVDGGRTWLPRNLIPVPLPTQGNKPGGALFADNALIDNLRFFNDRDGVIEVLRPGGAYGFPNGESFFYTTTDGGANWSPPSRSPSYPVDFISATAWVGPNWQGQFDRTEDGGKSWTAITPSFHTGYANLVPLIRPMDFVDPSHGWAGVGCSGILVVATADGGANWTLLSLPFAQPRDIGGPCI